MPNIKLVIQYDGTAYHGWQIQPDVVTVERILRDKLKVIMRKDVKLFAAARTDSGVHARCQVVNFGTDKCIPPEKLQMALNRLLPKDIVVITSTLVSESFNARRSARSRLYRYTVLNRKFRSPFDLKYCYFFPYVLDLDTMKKGAGFLLGTYDFTSFESCSGRRDVHIRTVKKLNLFSRAGFIHFDIQANGFLTHMVRIIMGTLLNVGRGKILPEDVVKILDAKDRRKAGPTLPARGLCLMKVIY